MEAKCVAIVGRWLSRGVSKGTAERGKKGDIFRSLAVHKTIYSQRKHMIPLKRKNQIKDALELVK